MSDETKPAATPPPPPPAPAAAQAPPPPPPPAPAAPPPPAAAAPVPGPTVATTSPIPAPPSGPPATAVPPFDPVDRARRAFALLDPTGLRPTAIVIGVILALFFGSQLVNAIIPARTNTGPGSGPISGPGQPGQTLPPIAQPTSGPGLPPGSVLTVGPLRIPLEPGWQPATTPSNNAVATLVKGSVQIDLVSLTIQGGTATPAGVYDGYIGIIRGGASSFSNSPAGNIQIGGGVPAARGNYNGVFGQNQVEGEVTAFVTGTTDAWAWDVWGATGTLNALLLEARRMIDNIQVQ